VSIDAGGQTMAEVMAVAQQTEPDQVTAERVAMAEFAGALLTLPARSIRVFQWRAKNPTASLRDGQRHLRISRDTIRREVDSILTLWPIAARFLKTGR
jgi:hypothetical protein